MTPHPSPFVLRTDVAPPAALAVRPEGIAPALRARPQWVAWRWGRTDKGKWTKVPVRADGRGLASTSNPATWATFAAALAAYRVGDVVAGVGYVFGDDESFVGIDLDHVRDSAAGTLLPWAADVVEALDTYTDISVSGTGVKMVAAAVLPGKRRKRDGHPGGGGVEMYQRRRFFALTGHTIGGQADVRPRPEVVARLQEMLLENPPWIAPKPPPKAPRPAATSQPLPSDDVLFERVRNSKHAAAFEALWRGDTSGYATADNAGHSEADLALCNLLRFYAGTGASAADVDRLFRRSGLMRGKWDERRGETTYGDITVAKALESGERYDADPGPTPTFGQPSANGVHADADAPEGPTAYAVTVDGRGALEKLPEPTVPPSRAKVHRTVEIFTGVGLCEAEFAAPNWVVPGLLSEGLNILAGKPKQGKSMAALNLALTIAAGGKALREIQTVPGDVLYLSLEDKIRRVQARAKLMAPGLPVEVNRRLHIATYWPHQDAGGLDLIRWWGGTVERPVLVIVDVWAKFKPAEKIRGSAYGQDYDNISDLKATVDDMGCSALVLMHCRKAAAEDVLEEVSGTMGLSGAADGIVVLTRSRGDNEAKIYTTGRDFQDEELAIQFDPKTLTWRSLGKAGDHMQTKVGQKIVAYLRGLGGSHAFAPGIAEAIDENPETVRRVLNRLRERGIVRKVNNAWSYPGDGDGEGATGTDF